MRRQVRLLWGVFMASVGVWATGYCLALWFGGAGAGCMSTARAFYNGLSIQCAVLRHDRPLSDLWVGIGRQVTGYRIAKVGYESETLRNATQVLATTRTEVS